MDVLMAFIVAMSMVKSARQRGGDADVQKGPDSGEGEEEDEKDRRE
jgi:hypothetical protein